MNAAQRHIKILIEAYQLVMSPLLGTRCRYHPTCSSYMASAVTEHGAITGVWLGFKRILRCHPWASGGCDPVPSAKTDTHHSHTPLSNAKAEQ